MTNEEKEMLGKLDHLLHHWREHNESHGDGYEKWIERVEPLGREDVAREIRKALELSRKMDVCFERAQALLKGEKDV